MITGLTGRSNVGRLGFFTPSTFDAARYVRKLQADRANWLVSTVSRKSAMSLAGEATINSEVLRDVCGSRYSQAVVAPLLGSGVLSRRPFSRSQKQSFRYRLSDRFDGDMAKWHEVERPDFKAHLAKRWSESRRRAERSWSEVHFVLREMLGQLEIDRDSALRRIDQLAPSARSKTGRVNRFGHRLLVEHIHAGKPYFKVDDYGRVHTPVTALRRVLRTDLRLEHERLVGIDIRNAQPMFLAALIRGCLTMAGGRATQCAPPNRNTLTADTRLFIDLTSEGVLYEYLVEATGYSRKECQHQLLVDVLARKGRYHRRAADGKTTVEDCFRREFPTVWKYVRQVNRSNHGELVRTLQRVESWFVIHKVVNWIRENHPGATVVSVHDSLFAAKSKSHVIEEAFATVGDNLGIRFGTKTEDSWNDD